MTDPRGTRAVCSGANHPFLDALYDRVVILDGAVFGTWMQARDLGPKTSAAKRSKDATRSRAHAPDLVSRMHDDFFAVDVDAVETATFGAFPLVLTEYGIAEQTFEINRRVAELAREVVSAYSTPDRPRWVVGLIGPGTRLPSLGQIPYVDLRDGYTAEVDGLLAGGIDVVLIETVYDLLQAKAAINGAKAAMAKAGVLLPLIVQVTVETTGRMLVGTEIGAALTALEAMRPDVIGMNCATGPVEMTEHLRYLSQHAGRSSRRCRTRGSRRSSTARPVTTSPPRSWPRRMIAMRPSSGSTSSAAAAAPRPWTCRLSSNASARAGGAHTGVRAGRVVDLLTRVRFHQELAYLAVGERTNANGSKKFREAMLEADWDTCVHGARGGRRGRARRVRRAQRVRRHGGDRVALRDAGEPAAGVRLHRAAGGRNRPAAPRREGDPQLRQPRGRRGRGPAHGPGVFRLARSTGR